MAILTLLSSFLLNHVMASVYTVGDQEEWSSQTNYASWAERYNFSQGDVLVFKYVKGQHNVYEVTEDTFRSCDASSGGVLAKYESGEDQVALSEVKRHWFICNIAGHCLGGMRFGIEVKDGNSVTNSTDVAFNPPIEPTPSHNSCTCYYVSERWRVIENFIPLGLLLLLNYYF
ncbi:Blue copper protein [Glycine soja]|nr:Blue copper protein [Glycine soja]